MSMRKRFFYTLFVIVVATFLFQLNAAANEKKSDILRALDVDGTAIEFTAFFSPTLNQFWCAEDAGSEPLNCSRPWTHEWELFYVRVNPGNGKTTIQSYINRKYVRVMPDNKGNMLLADVNPDSVKNVNEAHWKITANGIRSDFNKKFVTHEKDGPYTLSATSNNPVNYKMFEFIPICIKAVDTGMYARRTVVNDKWVIKMDSSTPEKFYLILDDDKAYIETSTFWFIHIDIPLTSGSWRKDQENYYSYTITTPKKKNNYWTIQSDSNGLYVGWDTSGDYKQCLLAKYSNTSEKTTHFYIRKIGDEIAK